MDSHPNWSDMLPALKLMLQINISWFIERNDVNFVNSFGWQDDDNGPAKRRGRPPKVKQPEAAETVTEKSRDSRTPTPTHGGEKTEEQKIEKDGSKFFFVSLHIQYIKTFWKFLDCAQFPKSCLLSGLFTLDIIQPLTYIEPIIV